MFLRLTGYRWSANFCRMAIGLCVVLPVSAFEIRVTDIDGNGLRNVVVTLDEATAVPVHDVTDKSVRVEQIKQQFYPRVTVVKPGTDIHFPNRDTTQHHVYSFSKANVFEIELYGGDDPDPIEFSQQGIVAIGCNIHDWMLGYVYVSPDPYFGTTDENGYLSLPATPSLSSTVTVWHPGFRNSAPLSVSVESIESEESGIYHIRAVLPNGNPLDVEVDALQSLFSSQQ